MADEVDGEEDEVVGVNDKDVVEVTAAAEATNSSDLDSEADFVED